MHARSLTTPASLALLNLAFLLAVGALAAGPLGAGALAAGVAAAATSAIVAGLLVSVLTRVPFEVTTSASSVVVIHASLGTVLAAQPGATFATVWASLSLAVVLAGLLLLFAARVRLADAIRFLPAPVSAGFVTGIGLLVIGSQVEPVLGISGKLHGLALADLLHAVRPGALLVGVVAALVVHAWQKYKLAGPANVLALLIATAVHHVAAASGLAVGPTIGIVQPAAVQAATLAAVASVPVAVVWASLRTVLPFAAFLALQALMNAAVVTPVASALAGQPVNVHRTVRAQGLANLVCGLLGALPVCTHTVITMTAARQKSRWQDVTASCLMLFGVLFLVGGLLAYLPVAALAGTLVMTGIALIDKWARRLVRGALASRGRDRDVVLNLALVSAVAVSFLVGSVPLALLVGSALAMVLLTVNLSRATRMSVQVASHRASTRVWAPQQAEWLATQRSRITIVTPRGGLFFGTAEQLARAMAAVPPTQAYCIVDMAKLSTLDASGCQLLAAGARRLAGQGTATLVAGMDPSSAGGRAMVALGLEEPPPAHWLPDVDHAMELAEARLLQLEGAMLPATDPVAGAPLTKGLEPADVEEIRALLARRTVPAGTLFSKGDAANSMFLVETGRVEIRVRNLEAGRITRLASFGPGSIFGEISLLSTGVRSADACCVEACVLHELTRAALDMLERQSPRVHAQVLRNLGVHLANRLVIATSTVEAQQ